MNRLEYVTPWTLPKVQNTTSAICELSAKYSIRATSRPKKIDIAIPDKIMLVALKFLIFDIQKIKSVGISEKIKAHNTIEIQDPIKLGNTEKV